MNPVLRMAAIAAFLIGSGALGSASATCQIVKGPAGPVQTIEMHVPVPHTIMGITSCTFVPGKLTMSPRPSLTSTLGLGFLLGYDSDHLSVSPGHGTVETFDGQIRYTPNPGYVGADLFAIDFADGRGSGSTLNVAVSTY